MLEQIHCNLLLNILLIQILQIFSKKQELCSLSLNLPDFEHTWNLSKVKYFPFSYASIIFSINHLKFQDQNQHKHCHKLLSFCLQIVLYTNGISPKSNQPSFRMKDLTAFLNENLLEKSEGFHSRSSTCKKTLNIIKRNRSPV